jgi:hypothetical protein
VRRIATAAAAVALFLLPAAAAQAADYTIQIHNQSSHNAEILVYQKTPNALQATERIRERIAPDEFFVSDEIAPDSCVLVRVAHEKGNPDARCKDNDTPVALRCDVSPRYSCKVHAGEVKDLVVNLIQPR